jgi:hypothetical protein
MGRPRISGMRCVLAAAHVTATAAHVTAATSHVAAAHMSTAPTTRMGSTSAAGMGVRVAAATFFSREH